MAGVPTWKKEQIQTVKSLGGIDSEDEEFINQLVELDMQNTTLSLNRNPPIMAGAQATQAKTTRESRDPRLRKRKISPYNQTHEELEPKKRKSGTDSSEGTSSKKQPTRIKTNDPTDHYPLREQKEGAWYVIYNTPSAPPSTPPHH